MSDSRRKSTVREAFKQNTKMKQRTVIVGKLRGRYLFRAFVRLVVEYKDWIGDDTASEQIGDDIIANVKMAKRKKKTPEEEELTAKDRGILLIPPEKRSKEDIAHIELIIKKVKAFPRYPEDVREILAMDVRYQWIPAGKVVVRQGHAAHQLYYIIKGELQILNDTTDAITGEVEQKEVGLLKAGDTFGEIALLHKVPRASTVVSKTTCDVLVLNPQVFNAYLRGMLLEEWDVLRDALVNFNYFKGWSEETMRECCILSKIVNFKPNEILLGDGKGMVHYVYFLLSGECRLIEHMLVEKIQYQNKVKYKIYDSKQETRNSRHRVGRSPKLRLLTDDLSALVMDDSKDGTTNNATDKDETSVADDYIKMISTKKSDTNIAMERLSVITVTLQDVINEWHEITDAVEMLMKKPSITDVAKYPKNVQTVFMQICIFYRGACFGLGEKMKNRRIVSITPTKCLLIPRYWLTKYNRANIWERVKQFMNDKYPDTKQLLDKYVENKMWAKYRREYAEDIVKQGREIPNDTKMYDVPYSIRINENIIDS